MDQKYKAQILSSFKHFENIKNKDLLEIAEYMSDKSIPAGKTFITEGSMDNHMYFIISGLVRVYHLHKNGKEMTVALRMPWETVGEMSLIDDGPRSANVKALENTQVLILAKENFLLLLQKYPLVGLHLLKVLSKRIREALEIQKLNSLENLKARTYHVIKLLSDHFQEKIIPFSHQELATLINATQPRTTEVLHLLEKEHKISLSRKGIQVLFSGE